MLEHLKLFVLRDDLVEQAQHNMLMTYVFLPVEHRSCNKDFKISSTILIPPRPYLGFHLEVFRQACFT